MKARVVVVLLAVVLPVSLVVALAVSRSGSSAHSPAKLPIVAGSGGGDARAAAAADAQLAPYPGYVYTAGPGLPALDGTARAYRLPAGSATDAAMAKLMDAFGMRGTPARADGAITVQDGDTQLTLNDGYGGSWGYSTGASVSVSSGSGFACASDAPDCPVPETTIPQRPASLPTEDEAKGIATRVLQQAGIDTAGATIAVDDFTQQWNVRIDPVVDGVPVSGMTTSVTIGDKGVIDYANGFLASPQPVDEYPLLGTAAAIDRLNRGEGFVGIRPMIAVAGATNAASPAATGAASAPDAPCEATTITAPDGSVDGGCAAGGSGGSPGSAPGSPPSFGCDGTGAPTTICLPPDPGSPTAVPPDTGPAGTVPPDTAPPITGTLPPQKIVLTGAERVLLFAGAYDGGDAFLVPGYRFTTEAGDEGPSVLAIDASFIAPPPGVTDPGGAKTDPGTSPGIEPQPAPAPRDTVVPETVPGQ
jgi:hypothetical protein